MMNYQIIKNEKDEIIGIFEPTIGCIPIDPANSDYQRYLRWVENPEAEQSTPNLAD
jgi:hypothetical protein